MRALDSTQSGPLICNIERSPSPGSPLWPFIVSSSPEKGGTVASILPRPNTLAETKARSPLAPLFCSEPGWGRLRPGWFVPTEKAQKQACYRDTGDEVGPRPGDQARRTMRMWPRISAWVGGET